MKTLTLVTLSLLISEALFAHELMDKLAADLVTPEPSGMGTKQAGVNYGTTKGITYTSKVTGRTKKANVITPNGYSESEKYPVLYVNHPIFGDENSMLGGDMGIPAVPYNLEAKGEVKKMIIVTTAMYTSKTSDGAPMGGFNAEVMAAYDAFLEDLTGSLMPYIEENYSVLTGRDNTAITGFSMGGREALYIGISRPDLFGYIGGSCPAPGIVPAVDQFMTHVGSMKESEFKIKDESVYPYIILISGAANDPVVGTFPKQYSDLLTKNGSPNVYHQVPMGSHDAVTTRCHLYNFCRYLFKGNE